MIKRHAGTVFAIAACAMGMMISASAQQAPKPIPIKVGVLKMAALTNPWVAKKQGIFEKNGLDVDLVQFRGGAEAIAAQRSGSVDVILSIPGTAMIADERGFDLVAIAQNEVAKKAGPDSGSIQVLKDSPYQRLTDLAGKKIAVSGLHSQKTVAMQTLFRRAGVDVSKLQLLEIPFSSQADALKSKQIDAVDTVDPYTTQLTSSGVGRVIAWDYTDTIPGQPLGAWFVKASYAKDHKDVIERFSKSIKESIDYMLADEQRARANVVAYTGLDASLVKDMPMIEWDYKVRPDKWQAVVNMMRENGELQSTHKADEYFAKQIESQVVQ